MATTVKLAKIVAMIEATETFSKTNTIGSASGSIDVINKMSEELNLGSGSSPDAELVYMGTQALTAGSLTLSLLALTNTEGATIATTGKKLRALMLKATSTNTAALVLTEGASNGYEFLGDGWKITLNDSNWILVYRGDDAPAIGASATNIDVTGTGTESFKMIAIFG